MTTIMADDVAAIQAAVRTALHDGANAVLTIGGTGIGSSDVTPEAMRPMLDREVPDIAEALRLVAREEVPTSVLSRGVAGAIATTLVITLPGSPAAVSDGMSLLLLMSNTPSHRCTAATIRPMRDPARPSAYD